MGKIVKNENSNPWKTTSIFDFQYFCCPECDIKSKNKHEFVDHASIYHHEVREILENLYDTLMGEYILVFRYGSIT